MKHAPGSKARIREADRVLTRCIPFASVDRPLEMGLVSGASGALALYSGVRVRLSADLRCLCLPGVDERDASRSSGRGRPWAGVPGGMLAGYIGYGWAMGGGWPYA